MLQTSRSFTLPWWATCRIRRLAPPRSSVPILGLTAGLMSDERRRCEEAGMDMVLTKPVVWPELFSALARLTADRPSALVGPT